MIGAGGAISTGAGGLMDALAIALGWVGVLCGVASPTLLACWG
jgi:hypothetical protein